MKKLLLCLLGYLICASPGQAQSVDMTDTNTGLKYLLVKSGTTCQAVLSGFDADKYQRPLAIIVPSTLPYDGDDYTVLGIRSNFIDWTELRGVALPPTMTSISMRCFKGCTNLEIANIGHSSLSKIPLEAFQGCSSLTEVEIPATVSQIIGSAFYNCTSLSKVTLNEGLQYIGWGAFANCDLREVTIPSTVTLAAIDIPELPNGQNVQGYDTASGQAAFINNRNLTSVTFNNVPTFIGVQMFAGCEKLTTVTFTQTTPPGMMASDAFPTDHAITVKVPEGCQSAYAAKFSAYSNITIEEDGPARRFIKVDNMYQLQDGGRYVMSFKSVSTNTNFPRCYTLDGTNLKNRLVADNQFTAADIWTFHIDKSKVCGATWTNHTAGKVFSFENNSRYAYFYVANNTTSAVATTEAPHASWGYAELNTVKNLRKTNGNDYNDNLLGENEPLFSIESNWNASSNWFVTALGTASNNTFGTFTNMGATAAKIINYCNMGEFSGNGLTYSTVMNIFLAVEENNLDVAARALWNAKAEEYIATYTEGKFTAETLAQCLVFPEGLTWSYDNLETEVAERFEAAKPRTRAFRVESAEALVDGLDYAIGTAAPASVTFTGNNYHPRFFELNLSTNASALTPVTDLTTFPGNMMWTFNREAAHDCTNSGDNHKGKTYTLSQNGRYFTFSIPTETKTATTLITQNYAEFIFKQSSDMGPIFKLHHVKQTGTGTSYNAAVGYNPTGGYGWGTYSDIIVNGDDYTLTGSGANYSYAFQVYHVVKSWAPGESAPYFWQVKRHEVEASDFTPELKQEILDATATMPDYAWTYEGIETEITEKFNAIAAPIIAEHLEGIADAMIDEHFSELKTWVDANKTEWSDDLTALIDDTKDAIELADDRTWTSEAIIEYVSGMYVELGIVNLEDMFTRLIAGKTYNLVSPHTEYQGNAVATNLEYNTSNNKARLIFDVNTGYTGFAFEAKEGATGLYIKEVATGKYMKVAPTDNNQGIEFSSDINEAGTYYVKNAAADTESLFIWGEGHPDRFLHCNANTASTANTLFTYTGTSLQNQWNLHKTTDLAAYNAAFKEEANNDVPEFEVYSTYGTKEFVTEEAIAAAAVNYYDGHEFTEADELTPATFAAKLEALAEYTYEKQDWLWSGASINGKNLLLLTGRAVSENRYLKAANNALAAPQNGVSAESVWNFEHAGGKMYRIYNPETGAYIKADRSLTVQPEATEEGEEENEWNAADEAELFYFAKSTATNGDAANAICICSSTATGDEIALHKSSGTNDNMMYWRVNDMASEFFVKLADNDLAAAAKLPFPQRTYPDFNSYKTWDEPGYDLGGYDPTLKAAAIYATTHVPTEAELADYIDNSNICSDNLIEVLHGRNTQIDAINAFEASKAFPQDGMYITLTSSPGNPTQGATLFDNENERNGGSTVSTSGNWLRLSASDDHAITEFNKIWFYKGGKMYSYATGHYLQGQTGGYDAKRHLTISKDTEHEETAAAAEAAAANISFANADVEINEFQMLHCGFRSVHIATTTTNGVTYPVANTCGTPNNVPDITVTTATDAHPAKMHNWHIDLVKELPVEIHADGYGSFHGHVAFEVTPNDNFTYYYATALSDNMIQFEELTTATKFAAGNTLIIEKKGGGAGTAYVKVLYNAEADELEPAPEIEAISSTHVALTHSDVEGKATFAKTAPVGNGTNNVRARVNGTDNKSVTLYPVGDTKPVNTLSLTVDSGNSNIDPTTGNLVLPLGAGVGTGIEAIELRRADGTSTVYDLQGRRLSEPRKGTVNIVNGKKVFVD